MCEGANEVCLYKDDVFDATLDTNRILCDACGMLIIEPWKLCQIAESVIFSIVVPIREPGVSAVGDLGNHGIPAGWDLDKIESRKLEIMKTCRLGISEPCELWNIGIWGSWRIGILGPWTEPGSTVLMETGYRGFMKSSLGSPRGVLGDITRRETHETHRSWWGCYSKNPDPFRDHFF